MSNPKEQLPIVNLLSPEELQHVVLKETLLALGVTDVDAYLVENVVDFRATFKANAGVAIAITGITKRPVKESKP